MTAVTASAVPSFEMDAPPLSDDAPHILVVDDDERIRDLLAGYLRQNGFRVTQASDGAAARSKLRSIAFDCLILDVMMPGESGFDIAEWLRKESDVAILMLTARSEPEHRVRGLELGVDDYVAKPFEPRELLLRLQNILRRHASPKTKHGEVRFGPFVFDLRKNELKRGDEPIRLTDREREVLREFALAGGELVSREDLARLGEYENERAVDVQINRLRQKIETDQANPAYLHTVRGKGYILYLD
ncbi:chemotaxis protein CheY [Rhodomicrobium udaipurense JA643]|jgi:two-component system phosphate regulon response regulator OmpR|uniref:Response regulator transcription factor n=1 Tax=Rhodomicrobium udaipurense TaxID=1202716 RepID=A0A8I1GCE6_9HYPH|nr:response regulator transcription factor [Rhodomicrobium udaipurense]KAI96379.1 chemotaxis protein CheY [Rhodomicrobium udaipurense JA643]MBJ7544503.1 response regulator transcription factor [Rhodomicrobium udaipurense]